MEERRKILIVDDERFNINVLADLLKPHYKIMAAINGNQALKAVHSSNPPDLILLDVMMPEMDGYEVCRRLKADVATRDIPVIFVTAMGQESDETKGLQAGAVDYITKPISPAIVEARVKTHMALKQNMEALQQAYDIIQTQKERMEQELNVGRDIQLSMLPMAFPAFPEHGEFTLHATMQAAREVGGDFYDFFFIDSDHLCLCIGDVSGKGVPAALFMAITKALIKSRATDDFSTASILTHVNDEIGSNNEASMFVTIFLAILDIQTGELLYTNAGHNPPYLKRRDGAVERMAKRHGPVVGAIEGLIYKEERTVLAKGDLLLLYTDGVTEAMDPEQNLFDETRLENLLRSGRFADPETLIQSTVSAVEQFASGAEQADDITVLALLYHKRPAQDGAQTFAVKIRNQLAELDRVQDGFEDFAQRHEIPQAISRKLNLVFDELLNNTISYGFPDGGEHELDVIVEQLEERLKIILIDDGIPFNPLLRETPDTELALEEREIGGLGIHLVRQLMDEFSYKRGVDKNIVTLIKYLDR